MAALTDAERQYKKRRKAGMKERVLKPCGTSAAYRRHRKAGEEPCEECVEAMRQEYIHYNEKRNK